ncbi:hypothetical protein NKR23_g9160 [Pleurostoma richardsiae]|uniref:Uncharacterized protein n=1 Tax=Pleurostoma richardsiae TaxID=41990 RepID=A0AA38RR73_9PEZI|nr:hypothetical protein NKR23_g9160 [Pleurostoma richardsiae]
MDFVKGLAGEQDGNESRQQQRPPGEEQETSGGFMDKLNSVAGGGRESEKKEDALDKGVDWVQEHVLGQGDQSNESALEQAKDEQISDFVRGQYKKATGSDIPVKDKER